MDTPNAKALIITACEFMRKIDYIGISLVISRLTQRLLQDGSHSTAFYNALASLLSITSTLNCEYSPIMKESLFANVANLHNRINDVVNFIEKETSSGTFAREETAPILQLIELVRPMTMDAIDT